MFYSRCLSKAGGFHLTPRSRDCLPQGFPSDIEGTCHFLDSYSFPYIDDLGKSPVDHISCAVEHYKIKEENNTN